ncbi:hypothetical protein VFPFJ_06817 [Purpureocillium lilacinum]|uniref:Uncharacterized protein n=1 Tax=Purpureocillium lilacinum TaxID=33203 RepID=A0A179HEF0_PURLI|nr:hypothetical protein VFPFJ_06817 [Purpureocillium lilacinum]OAQ88352.1 hypothetical protein VFPFJ_06817 [Purpureocillium lilacinum]
MPQVGKLRTPRGRFCPPSAPAHVWVLLAWLGRGAPGSWLMPRGSRLMPRQDLPNTEPPRPCPNSGCANWGSIHPPIRRILC